MFDKYINHVRVNTCVETVCEVYLIEHLNKHIETGIFITSGKRKANEEYA